MITILIITYLVLGLLEVKKLREQFPHANLLEMFLTMVTIPFVRLFIVVKQNIITLSIITIILFLIF